VSPGGNRRVDRWALASAGRPWELTSLLLTPLPFHSSPAPPRLDESLLSCLLRRGWLEGKLKRPKRKSIVSHRVEESTTHGQVHAYSEWERVKLL
jgi:hypothetical protein